MNYKKIGMVVAMDKEVSPFLDKMGKALKTQEVGGHKVFSYKINGKEVYLIKSGIGEIYAASATAILINLYKCDLILNFGVCGSLISKVGVMQSVVVKGVVHYDFDLSEIDKVPVGQYPDYDNPVMKTNRDLIDLAISISGELKEVICASADKFVSKPKIKKLLNKTYGAEVCDMECAGVLLTCDIAKIPCLIIKAVSDGNGGVEEFNKTVKSASKVYIDTVSKILETV